MELVQTTTRTVNQVTATQDGWMLNASVTVQNGRVVSVDGNARKQEDAMDDIGFTCWREGDVIKRNINNVDDGSKDVYTTISALVDAVVEKYEG